MRRVQIGGANYSGITKPDLTLRGYWRRIQSGNLPPLFMKNSLRLEPTEAKKQKPVSTSCAWNIFFGRTDLRWPKLSCFCPELPRNKLARTRDGTHNQDMKTRSKLSRVCGWSVRCASGVLTLALCASTFAADPSKNVMLPAQPQRVTKITKKVCLVVTGSSAIPQSCERLAAIPTTANPMSIYGHRPGR